jgi:hypothetical protein
MEGFTYDQLFAALQTWPVNSDQAYRDNLPRIIVLGETRVVRDLNLNIFDIYDDGLLLTTGDNIIAKPDELIALRSMRGIVTATGAGFDIEMRSLDYVKSFANDPAVTGRPRYVADLDELQWCVGTVADDDYTIEALYVARPDGLSASNQNTWLGDKVGDLIFHACLMEADHYIKADDRYGDISKKYHGGDSEPGLLTIARAELRNHIRNGDYQPLKPAAKTADARE